MIDWMTVAGYVWLAFLWVMFCVALAIIGDTIYWLIAWLLQRPRIAAAKSAATARIAFSFRNSALFRLVAGIWYR